MDCYRDLDDVERTFVEFLDHVPFYGMVVACNDNDDLRRLLPAVRRRTVTYGTREGSDFLITDMRSGTAVEGQLATSAFRVQYHGKDLGEFHLHVPGEHNVRNATAAIAVGIGLDIPVEKIRAGLEKFNGVDRRFQLKGRANGVTVIDDYGHHPTEIRATLAAARECGFRKIHVIFQPHRYTRTQLLLDDFATAFDAADSVTVLDIYAASESPIPGITGELLAERISHAGGTQAIYANSFAEAAELASTTAQPGDLVLTLGAGNVVQLAPQVLEALETHAAQRLSR
jgi:UDP-N-acetylmuramate--alanine ligase